MTASIDEQGRMLAPATGQLGEGSPLSIPYAGGGVAGDDSFATARLLDMRSLISDRVRPRAGI